jgi:hypothetical protein
VTIKALKGSPRKLAASGLKNGIISSLDTACNNRGALVKLCRPAPNVDKNAPTKITHLLGQASTLTTSFLLILSPNLSLKSKPSMQEPNSSTFDKS